MAQSTVCDGRTYTNTCSKMHLSAKKSTYLQKNALMQLQPGLLNRFFQFKKKKKKVCFFLFLDYNLSANQKRFAKPAVICKKMHF